MEQRSTRTALNAPDPPRFLEREEIDHGEHGATFIPCPPWSTFGEVAQRVAPDPARGAGRRGREALGDRDRLGPQLGVAPSDRAQGPAHALLDEVPLIAGSAFDERKAAEKWLVDGALVVEREAREQREGRAPDKLVACGAPLRDLGPRVGRLPGRYRSRY